MDLLTDILTSIIKKQEIAVIFPNLDADISEMLEKTCYQALKRIKSIIENDSLSDFECVEEIVCVFEDLGSNGGIRHDFG